MEKTMFICYIWTDEPLVTVQPAVVKKSSYNSLVGQVVLDLAWPIGEVNVSCRKKTFSVLRRNRTQKVLHMGHVL